MGAQGTPRPLVLLPVARASVLTRESRPYIAAADVSDIFPALPDDFLRLPLLGFVLYSPHKRFQSLPVLSFYHFKDTGRAYGLISVLG